MDSNKEESSSAASPSPLAIGHSTLAFMREALELARRGVGWTSPNPAVGAVVVRDGVVLGCGWHAELGGLHAEAAALIDAGDARGATCYVTLEPCSHIGRQPPCCNALIEAGVARVVYGVEDVDPRSAGRARAVLEDAGIAVESGVLAGEIAAFLDAYLFAHRHGLPQVRLKLALSLDGKLACAGGASQWLSGPESLGLAHWLRQSHDAVLVGPGTVLQDDPRLTVRADMLERYLPLDGLRLRDPVRVVLDPRFELLPRLAELRLSQPGQQRADRPGLIVAGLAGFAPAGADDLATSLPLPAMLIEVEPVAGNPAVLSWPALWDRLWELGIRSVLVEGGGRVAAGILRQHAADRLTAVYTPVLLGSDARGFSPPLGAVAVADGLQLHDLRTEQLGADIVVTASFQTNG